MISQIGVPGRDLSLVSRSLSEPEHAAVFSDFLNFVCVFLFVCVCCLFNTVWVDGINENRELHTGIALVLLTPPEKKLTANQLSQRYATG